MNKEEKYYYENKYRHLNLYFSHHEGWDELTLSAALLLDTHWPKWMPNWLKRLNNYLLYAFNGKSIIKITKFYYSPLRKIFPFIKDYPRFSQIKEKYGSLRLYTTSGCPKLFHNLELISYITCERCGNNNSGRINDCGWIYTCCEQCAKQYYTNKKWKPVTLKIVGNTTEISS